MDNYEIIQKDSGIEIKPRLDNDISEQEKIQRPTIKRRELKLKLMIWSACSIIIMYYSITEDTSIFGKIINDVLVTVVGDIKLIIVDFVTTFIITVSIVHKYGFDSGVAGLFFYNIISKLFGDTVLIIVVTVLYTYILLVIINKLIKSKIPIKNIKEQNNKLSFEFSPLDFLISKTSEKTNTVNDVFNSFGVDAEIANIIDGLSVIRYELKLGSRTKFNEITKLEDNIRIALKSESIIISDDKGTVFIDVPKREVNPIYFSDIENISKNSPLEIPIGKDIKNKTKYFNIKDFPHLLISGATGSGKSVFINTLICSLIKENPETLRLVLIDPKMVELSVYNDIPHLLTNEVITDQDYAVDILKSLIEEMENRFSAFKNLKVRDIEIYNQKSDSKFPYIIVIIDELADLITNIEDSINILARKSRAAGIYLILATQRPSVDVITGTIKANIPSRISFAVSSSIDSKTILDMTGAEKVRL